MNLNKAFIDGKIYDVVEFNELGCVNYIGDALAVHYLNFILPVRMSEGNKPVLYEWNVLFRYYPKYRI